MTAMTWADRLRALYRGNNFLSPGSYNELADHIEALTTEAERLRAVAWQLRKAMVGQHENASHWLYDSCKACDNAADQGDSALACDQYKAWQKAYMDALGLAIGR